MSLTDNIRKRFHEASVERAGMMEKLRPIHAQHKDLVKQIQALEEQAKPLAEAMLPIRNQLAELENEIARCARFAADGSGISRMGKAQDHLTTEEAEAAFNRGLNS